jgi:hypothetical protein
MKRELSWMIRKRTLHILNGQEMYNYFKETHFLEQEMMVPFNEAMCYGTTCNDLFSHEFTEIRAKVHHVTPEQYTEITLKPLQPNSIAFKNESKLKSWVPITQKHMKKYFSDIFI